MHVKHQYIQESEYEIIIVIYIPIEKYKYKVITKCDPILHEFYFTKGVEFRLQGMNNIKDAHELRKGNPVSWSREGR